MGKIFSKIVRSERGRSWVWHHSELKEKIEWYTHTYYTFFGIVVFSRIKIELKNISGE